MRVKSPKMDLGLRPPACKKRKIISIFGPVNPAHTTKKVLTVTRSALAYAII